jgi:hypothetical protein
MKNYRRNEMRLILLTVTVKPKKLTLNWWKSGDFELDLDHLWNGDFEFELGLAYGAERHFQQYFSYIVAVFELDAYHPL